MKYELAYVKWVDTTATDTGWHSIHEADDWIQNEPNIVHQVGFIYTQTKDYITLLDSYVGDTLGVVTKIPTAVVLLLEILPIDV